MQKFLPAESAYKTLQQVLYPRHRVDVGMHPAVHGFVMADLLPDGGLIMMRRLLSGSPSVTGHITRAVTQKGDKAKPCITQFLITYVGLKLYPSLCFPKAFGMCCGDGIFCSNAVKASAY